MSDICETVDGKGTLVAYNESISVTYALKMIKLLKFSAGKHGPLQTVEYLRGKKRKLFVRHLQPQS